MITEKDFIEWVSDIFWNDYNKNEVRYFWKDGNNYKSKNGKLYKYLFLNIWIPIKIEKVFQEYNN